MAKPREFTTVPARAIADTRLSALDLRCLMVVALHDGMSLMKGSGPGCFAKSATLAELVRTDVSNLSKSLNRLIKLGYVLREAQPGDKRRFTHRVIYGADDSWRDDQQSQAGDRQELVGDMTNYSDGEIVGRSANDLPRKVGQSTNYSAEVVGEMTNFPTTENRRYDANSKREFRSSEGSDYIPLNGELNSVETGELNSVETAHLAFRETRRTGDFVQDAFTTATKKRDCAKAPAIQEWALAPHLPRNFTKLPLGAMLQRFEDAFSAIGRDAEQLERHERMHFSQWLWSTMELCAGEDDALSAQARRLHEEVAVY